MKNPNIKTKVVHSQSKKAWNVVGSKIGNKYKVAHIPYFQATPTNEAQTLLNEKFRSEAFNHAQFISYCFNNSERILNER